MNNLDFENTLQRKLTGWLKNKSSFPQKDRKKGSVPRLQRSERLRDSYDDWIEDEERLKELMNEYMHERKKAQGAFSVKYRGTIDPEANLWERCASVLSRRDIVSKLSEP
jgi:hypothetical protein